MLKFFLVICKMQLMYLPKKYLFFFFFKLLAEHSYILWCLVFLFFFSLSSGNFENHFLPHEKIYGIFIKCMNQSWKQDMDETYRDFSVHHSLYKSNNTYWQKSLYLLSPTFKSSCSFHYFTFPFSPFWFRHSKYLPIVHTLSDIHQIYMLQ